MSKAKNIDGVILAPAHRQALVREKLAQNKTQAVIAEELGVTHRTITRDVAAIRQAASFDIAARQSEVIDNLQVDTRVMREVWLDAPQDFHAANAYVRIAALYCKAIGLDGGKRADDGEYAPAIARLGKDDAPASASIP